MSSHHSNPNTRSPPPSRGDRGEDIPPNTEKVPLVHNKPQSPPASRRVRREDAEPNSEKIPLVTVNDEKPPLAGPETDDDPDDDREVVSQPYPGVDDGFFNGDPEKSGDEVPTITSRAGPEGGSEKPDEVDGVRRPELQPGRFPYAPSFGPDLETGSALPGDLESIPDVNVYQHKKTLAQGMMDLALFSANANQLRYVLESFNRHPFFYPSLVLISFSLILQVSFLYFAASYNL